jgi:hypothetical protein
MGNVANTHDGVVGADAASPVPEQAPVHFLDRTERPPQPRRTEGCYRCRSDQIQVLASALPTIRTSASAG